MRSWTRRPSPATVTSAIALFVSLGGVGYAAATIGSAQIKDNAVASRDIKNRTINTKDINRKTIRSLRGRRGAAGARGATGAMGATGATGAPGTALAFARVNSDGTVDTSRSQNIAGSNVTHTTMSGIYCFDGLGFTPKNVVATAESSDRTVHVFGQAIDAGACAGDEDFFIEIRDLTPASVDGAFQVLIN
jgi:hypothetical protein